MSDKPPTQEEEAWRGARAEQLLNEPLIKDALDGIEAKIVAEWSAAPVKDTDLRERLWAMYGISKAFRARLREHIETGKLASVQLQQKGMFRRIF